MFYFHYIRSVISVSVWFVSYYDNSIDIARIFFNTSSIVAGVVVIGTLLSLKNQT